MDGSMNKTPAEQVAALTWETMGEKLFFRGVLGRWPRLIGGDSKEGLLDLAHRMAEGRA